MYRMLAVAFREGIYFDVHRLPAMDFSYILTPPKLHSKTSTTYTEEARVAAAAKDPIVVENDNPNAAFQEA